MRMSAKLKRIFGATQVQWAFQLSSRVRRRVSLRFSYWLCCLPWFVQLRRKEPRRDRSRRCSTSGVGREAFSALVAQLAVRPVMVGLVAVVLSIFFSSAFSLSSSFERL